MNKPPQRRSQELVFVGSGSEFFGIWIVNILLSILTLGIYSAWAKVRTINYFYGSTLLDGFSFAYKANPVAILKGRIIAGLFLLCFTGLQSISPIFFVLMWLAIFALAPFVIGRSLMFKAFNTEYRGLRFGFAGTTADAYKVFMGFALLAILSLGILFPWFYKEQKHFIIGNFRFGGTQFTCKPSAGVLYRIALLCLLYIAVPLAMVSSFELLPPISIIGFILLWLSLIIVPASWKANATNHVLNSTDLGGIAFKSDMKTSELVLLWIGNSFLILFTLGLAIPWVMARNARYRISRTTVLADDLNSFIEETSSSVSAIGDEMGEALEVELGI